jgi:hypothetical protein
MDKGKTKKIYEKPSYEEEKVLERLSLACKLDAGEGCTSAFKCTTKRSGGGACK